MGKVKVLLDTNVVIDFFSGRMNDGMAAKLVAVGRDARFEMCISFLTAINTLYVAKKMGLAVQPEELPGFFTILPQDIRQWNDATELEMTDFEDAAQAACALHNECVIAVSRDRHFENAPMSVLTPEQFLSLVLE